jgi:hypothetical protein
LGIKSHGQGTGHKKRARMPRVPQARARSAKVEAGLRPIALAIYQ